MSKLNTCHNGLSEIDFGTVKMGGRVVFTFYVILSLQLAFGLDTNYIRYQNANGYSYRLANPQLANRNAFPQKTVIPIMNQLNATDDIRQAAKQISEGSEIFSFNAVHAIANAVRDYYDANFVVAPFSVWSLMLLIAEGAAGQSFTQMEQTLRLPKDLKYVRTAYKEFQRLLVVNTSTIELAVNQALFSDLNSPINRGYGNILENDYEADHVRVNFLDKSIATKTINDHISAKTRGKIQNVIKPDDLTDAQLLLTSTIFFRGQWKFPFNISHTTEQPFFQENGRFIANVTTMYQRGVLPFAAIRELGANAVELPYGKENRLCMVVLLPHRQSNLTAVFKKLGNEYKMDNIFTEMHKFDNIDDDEENEIELYLPRFRIDSDLQLRTVLQHLGITDIFDPAKANLLKLSRQPTFVSRVFHKAIIEVNEEGTVAAAVTGGTVSFKQSPIEFNVNRPFGFLIAERATKTLLFAGQVKHPQKG